MKLLPGGFPMELTQMRYFMLVAENGSTAKAAAEAMVSRRISST